MTATTFFVRGTPAPQGSHRAFVRGGRAIVTDDSTRTRPWRTDVRAAAQEAWPHAPLTGALSVFVSFAFARPASHTGRRGLLPSAPCHKTTRPDLDKLVRSTLDALTGIVIVDDSLIVDLHAVKGWASDGRSGCLVSVEMLEDAA